MARLGREFFGRYTPDVAKDLLGCRLVSAVDGRRLSGVIVETEAYRGRGDPASHAYSGRTTRNAVMFGEPGHAYVYFSYGFHNCLNVTTERPGSPGAVLLRALEPVEGAAEMMENRGGRGELHVADGPGKLAQALRIDRSLNGEDMVTSRRLFIEFGAKPLRVSRSGRIGVSRGAEMRWRFYIAGSRFVSQRRPQSTRAQNP